MQTQAIAEISVFLDLNQCFFQVLYLNGDFGRREAIPMQSR